MSKAAAGDFFSDHLRQHPLGLEPGQLGENAGLRSGGEANGAADEMSVDDGVEVKEFLIWLLCHIGQIILHG